MGTIPPFPRHMSPAERAIERKRIVHLMIAEITVDNPGTTLSRDKLTLAFTDLITITWHVDRIVELEGRVEAMAQQLAALETQPVPALAKRATLKLKGG